MGSVDVQRKHVVVTGGASGIGLAISKSFAERGATVSILDVNPEGAAVVKSLIKDYPSAGISFRQADISNWDELAAAFEAVYAEQGRIDVVMANAGISKEGPLIVDEEKPTKPSFKTVDVNLTGTLYTIYLAIHYIKKNEANGVSKGSIIATASNAGLYAFSVAPIYAATKFGVVGLVRSLARPLAKELIQINALAPAVLETNIAPDKDLFKHMVLTPMSTLTKGVHQLLSEPSLTGQVAEIHGEHVTLNQQPAYVDEDTGVNIETFWNLGYA